MSKLTAEQRVQKAHVWLMKHPKYCLYSGVLMIGKTEVKDEGCPTAYTDGRNTAYGRKFVDKLSESDLKGLILHENLHKAFRHTTVWKHLYKEGIPYFAMFNNGYNHPNAPGHRLFVEEILKCFHT